MNRILWSLLLAALPLSSVHAQGNESKNAKVTLVYQHELPNVPGKSIKGVLVEYGPGGYSPGHMHPKSAFIYATVLEGAISSQVNDGPVTIYSAGQSFSEMPGDRHGVSANASKTQPAKRAMEAQAIDRSRERRLPLQDERRLRIAFADERHERPHFR
jgi:quercetin dioxygenase-like cupin family protein